MTIALLPFVAAWGLSLSLVSVIGNIIHGFFLPPFLLVSSLLFFSEIFGIPNAALVSLLSCIHTAWSYVLRLAPQQAVIGLSAFHALSLCAGLAALLLMQQKKKRAACVCIALSLCGFTYAYITPPAQTVLLKGKRTLTFLPQPNGTLLLCDDGYISRTKNTNDLVEYRILPHIRRHYGMPLVSLISKHEGSRIRAARRLLE